MVKENKNSNYQPKGGHHALRAKASEGKTKRLSLTTLGALSKSKGETMKKKILNVEKGDLVRVAGHWKRVGIVKGTDKNWWVIAKHVDVDNCIVDIKEVVEIIQKQVVPKKYFKYIK